MYLICTHCQVNRAFSFNIGITRLPGEQAEESLGIPVWGQKMQANIGMTDRAYDRIESYSLRNGPNVQMSATARPCDYRKERGNRVQVAAKNSTPNLYHEHKRPKSIHVYIVQQRVAPQHRYSTMSHPTF